MLGGLLAAVRNTSSDCFVCGGVVREPSVASSTASVEVRHVIIESQNRGCCAALAIQPHVMPRSVCRQCMSIAMDLSCGSMARTSSGEAASPGWRRCGRNHITGRGIQARCSPTRLVMADATDLPLHLRQHDEAGCRPHVLVLVRDGTQSLDLSGGH